MDGYGGGQWWATKDLENSTVVVDFKESMVSLSGYSLKSPSCWWSGGNLMRNWSLDGSNDNWNWTPIHEVMS
jgi:hypothetical protein